ncbi:hypothetical protein ACP4OV_023834 [Aristida adscensionis]
MAGSRKMESPICLWGSSMVNLPGRLHGLLQRHGQMLPRGAAEEVLLIKRDVEEIISVLSELGEHRAMVARCWIKEVRELSYDMEDFLDLYEHGSSRSRTRSNPHREITKRCKSKEAQSWHHEKLRQRLWTVNKIREFSLRVQEALQRHGMYGIASTASAITCKEALSNNASRRSPTFGDGSVHVGIGGAMNKLEDWLMSMHDGAEKLKLVSIVGRGGVGKTTLAIELYRKLGWKFQCRAFVRTSQKLDMRRLFISMLSQVCPHQLPDNWTVHSLISCIRTHLEDKRYLIIVDDLWASSTWDAIRCALPAGNSGSRVVTTTEIEELALQSCGYDYSYIFEMKPLGEVDSRKLFFHSVFGPHHECPPELGEVSNDIIRKCGGLPLAIVTIASILSSQSRRQEQWDYVNKSLGYSLMTDPTLEGLKQVLSISYESLPQHLKPCMLYTSIYEESSTILKDDLVNQWVAEGFICATKGQDKQGIAGTYFDDLVSRKMIYPVDINDNGEVLSCFVHHVVLNFIMAHKALEENFVTPIHHSQATTILSDKVRRLSLHFGNAEDAIQPANMRLSQVRTLAFFGMFKCMPSIVEFRLLQVLILHLWGDTDSISLDFTKISELFRLRYLKVTSNVTLELQAQMRGLQQLETLEIDARLSAAPSDIAHLQGLLHLKLPAEAKLPNGIGHMTLIRTLGYFDLSVNSLENVMSLRKLTNLRDLQLTCSTMQEPYYLKGKLELLLDSIHGELRNLKSLTLESRDLSNGNTPNDDGNAGMGVVLSGSCVNTILYSLQRFEFSRQICIFSCLPKCVRHLDKLCILKIGLSKIVANDVEVLRGLPALTVLCLYVHIRPTETIVIGNTGFSVLKYFKFKCCDPRLKFEAGSMPNLQKLKLGFNAQNACQQITVPIGIEHLSGLKEVSTEIGGAGLQESDRKTAEMAFGDAIRVHGNCTRVIVHCVNKIFGFREDQSSIKREEENTSKKIRHSYEKITESRQKESKHADIRFLLSEWQILLLLRNKSDNQHDDITRTIPVVDSYSVDPWKLEEISGRPGEPCFCFRPLQETAIWGDGPNQTPSGYWKPRGSAEHVYSAEKLLIGTKRTMEYYHGQVAAGNKTCWRIKEFIAFQEDTSAAIGSPHTKRSKMSFCALYSESTAISTGACNSTGPLEEEEHKAIKQSDNPKEEPSENINFIPVVSGAFISRKRKLSLQNEITQVSQMIHEMRNPTAQPSRRQPSRAIRVRGTDYSLDDGYSWRKYGQKEILGAKHPRAYYRCLHRHSQGCQATKQLQRTDHDPDLSDVVYHGVHTCVQLKPAPSTAQSSLSVCTMACSSASVEGGLESDVDSQLRQNYNFLDDEWDEALKELLGITCDTE